MGRTAVLLVLGLSALIGTYSYIINSTETEGTKNIAKFYYAAQARDIAHSSVNLVLHKLDENIGVSGDTTFNGSFQGGSYTIKKKASADTVWLDVKSVYADTNYAMKLKLLRYPKPFPVMVGAVNISSDSISFSMNKNSEVNGNDTNPDGSAGPTAALPAVTVSTALDSARVAASGGTLVGPSRVRTSPNLPRVTDYIDEYWAYATAVLPASVSGNNVYGSTANPAILVRDGDLSISGGTTIYGILVVKGNLELKGTVNVYGMIIVYGETVAVDLNAASGTPQVYGGLLLTGPSHSSFSMNGTGNYYYSSKALNDVKNAKALRAYSVVEWWE
ncbi:MAG: hypothetical protein ACM3Q4_06110 [Acidobacteriota bacterium]